MVTYAEMVEEHRRSMDRQRESIARLSTYSQPNYSNPPINHSGQTPSVGGEIVRAAIFAAMVASKTFRRTVGIIGAAVMAFVGLEIVYSNLVDPSWQGVGGNAVYSFLEFLVGAFLVGLYFLTAIMAVLARFVVREAREDFGENDDE
jgi:hypothetical protein